MEQDNGQYQVSLEASPTADDLYVTSTSYPLIAASAPSGTPSTASTNKCWRTFRIRSISRLSCVVVVVLFIVAIAIYCGNKKERQGFPSQALPSSVYASSSPSSTPFQSEIDLGSKPPEQVVIRDVAKVNCKYCGTLIPSTADTCPYCGGPRHSSSCDGMLMLAAQI